jgi:hypothetical protein
MRDTAALLPTTAGTRDESSGPWPRAATYWSAVDIGVAIALLGLAAYARYRPLAPSSLWLDDSWAAIGYKATSARELWRTMFTSPLFSLGTALWLKAVGLSSLRAQMLAFIPGVLGPPVLYFEARQMRLGRPAALLAATAILVAPFHMQYSTHVKQYTLEALLSAAVLGVGWWLLNAPDAHRWRALALVATVATLSSMAVAPIVAGAYAAGFWALRRHRDQLRNAIVSVAAYGGIVGAWYLAVIKPESHPALRQYWQQLGGFWTHHRGHVSAGRGLVATLEHVAHGFSGLPKVAVLWIMAVAIVIAFFRSTERAILLVVPFAVALTLSGLQIAPLGARVDVYLYPTFAILLAYAAQPLFTRASRAWILAPVALGLLLLTTPLPNSYQQENARPLVARLEADAKPADPVLIYPTGRFAFALYTHWPVEIVRDPTAPVPFTPIVLRPGVQVVTSSAFVSALLAQYRTQPSVRRVWFFGTHGRGPSVAAMTRSIERGGFVRTLAIGDLSAWLYEFQRSSRS